MLRIREIVPQRFKALYRWFANSVLWLTAGYGEKPQRVLGVSVGIVIVFTGIFYLLREGFSTIPPYGHPVGYLLVSLESFVTLVLGASTQIKQSPDAVGLRLAAQFEGFLGVFLIALFVFTLTRSIHR